MQTALFSSPQNMRIIVRGYLARGPLGRYGRHQQNFLDELRALGRDHGQLRNDAESLDLS